MASPDSKQPFKHANQRLCSSSSSVRKSFWPGFEEAAGVFCTGEVLHGGESVLAFTLSRTADLITYNQIQTQHIPMHIRALLYPLYIISPSFSRYGKSPVFLAPTAPN